MPLTFYAFVRCYLKVSLGYRKDTYQAAHILPFVEYCARNFSNAREITKEMLDSFRMELCCGMRANEPLNLLTEDVDLNTGDIFIRKSKRGKDLHIIISEDMRRLCARYDRLAGKRQRFFQHWEGGKLPTTWPRHKLMRAWVKTGLAGTVTPRPYDLHHNFATRTLIRWTDEKRDVMALMPYLSTYMGHVTLEETLYYVHLLPERLKQSPGIDWDMLRGIYRTEEWFSDED